MTQVPSSGSINDILQNALESFRKNKRPDGEEYKLEEEKVDYRDWDEDNESD